MSELPFDYLKTGSVIDKAAQEERALEMFRKEIRQRYGLLSRLQYDSNLIISRLLSNFRWELETLPEKQREALYKELSQEIDALEMTRTIENL
ncbi:MAG: hypothetical protein ACE5GM_10930 [bacterium]